MYGGNIPKWPYNNSCFQIGEFFHLAINIYIYIYMMIYV